MKIVKMDGLVFLRHWRRWYVMRDNARLDQPALMKFESLKPFWEGVVEELIPDVTNTKLKGGNRASNSKSRA